MINRGLNLPATGRLTALSVGMALCLTLSAGAAPATAATHVSAATTSKSAVVVFKNCTALTAKYPGGVAKAGIKVNLVNGKKKAFTKRPTFSTALYTANKKSDRDKDGIACEK
ncbi:excalibur calcium-binding domain-containing protein [Cryobacterium sp. AP23]